MSPRPLVPLALAVLVIASTGCEGTLEGGNRSGPVPQISVDAGPGGGSDASAPSDAAAPPGCDLPSAGECAAGEVARYCEAGVAREERCADTGRVCDFDEALGRHGCVDEEVEPPPPPPPGCGEPIEQEVLALANEARAANGLGPLVCDPEITVVARAHSQDMCDQNYFSHTGLDGRSPFDRMRDAGIAFSRAGENIARGQTSAAQVHNSWMNSPGHRANILNGGYGRIGIGYVACGGRPLWTQKFAN